MRFHARLALVGVACLTALGADRLAVQDVPPASMPSSAPSFSVDGRIALHSLASLSDAHLQKIADVLALAARTAAARSGEWTRVRPHLAEAARVTVPAVFWYSRPDGTYWTLTQGLATARLTDRAYFPRLLAGETVLGALVTSHSTGRNTAIVAVPVRGRRGEVIGMLGSSVHLDSLTEIIRGEMGGLGDSLIFYAVDDQPLGALNSDPELIFSDPMALGDDAMRAAFREMLARTEGVVTYEFRGNRRTVMFRKSDVTGWRYGFGVLSALRADR